MPQSIAKLALTTAVIAAGASLAFQQVLNARLRVELDSPWWAGFFSYLVGLLVMLAAILIAGEARLPMAALSRIPWIAWTGGLFGAIFVGTAILTVPRLGVATVLVLAVVGQTIASIIFDRIGLLGLVQQSITPIRLAGIVFLVLGVVCMRF